MGDTSGGNCSMNNHTLSQQDCNPNIDDVSSGYGFINSHTLSQCEYSNNFKELDGKVKNGDASSGYGSMNSNADSRHNSFKLLMNYNDRDETDMNANLQNGYVSIGIDLLNIHTTRQYNESSNLNDIIMGV